MSRLSDIVRSGTGFHIGYGGSKSQIWTIKNYEIFTMYFHLTLTTTIYEYRHSGQIL